MDNNIISFEQIQKFLNEVDTWFANPIDMESIQENLLNNLRPKMEWIKEKDSIYGHTIYYCSNCGNDEYYQPNFCPECGAMRRDLE